MLPSTQWHTKCFIKLLVLSMCIIVFYVLACHIVRHNGKVLPSMQMYSDKREIPPIVHQSWKTYAVPSLFQSWMQSWTRKNPTWEYWFWTDEDTRQLIAQKFPDYLDLYDRYPSGAHRADAFKYFVMYEHGGVYADLDVECLLPLDPLIEHHDCLIAQEPAKFVIKRTDRQPPLVSNAIIACRTGHPFFLYMIMHLRQFAGVKVDIDAMNATGKFMMTKVFRTFQQIADKRYVLHVADSAVFNPTFGSNNVNSSDEFDNLSLKLNNTKYEKKAQLASYTNHHWKNVWTEVRSKTLNDFDVRNVINITTKTSYRKHVNLKVNPG